MENYISFKTNEEILKLTTKLNPISENAVSSLTAFTIFMGKNTSVIKS
jgi:hypothetical protein